MLNGNILQDDKNETCLRNGTYTPEPVRRNSCQLLSFEVMLLPGFYVFTVYWFFAFLRNNSEKNLSKGKRGEVPVPPKHYPGKELP